jgi:transcriptional regulator with XRE-family HTH domain
LGIYHLPHLLAKCGMNKSTFTREYRVLCGLLRKFRIAAGRTQVDIADAIGETQSYVSKCERGERRLDIVQLRAFCSAMGTNLPTFVAAFEAALGQHKRG